jgi:hypothetical protein
MPSFNEYLRRRHRCPEDYISLYAGWADLFRAHLEQSGARADDQDAFNSFLASQRAGTTEWQMRQAHRALCYYAGYQDCTAPGAAGQGRSGGTTAPARDEALRHLTTAIRLRHLAHRTEDAYRGWATRFLLFTGSSQLSRIGEKHLKEFLTHLAVERKVSAATQRQAFNSMLFFFRNVLSVPVDDLASVVRAKIG